jgi:uncharacterized cysteine cluster protein YcgN (CxxCxxCC family)
MPAPFWRSKSLDALNEAEWESLCDGCARCCLHKLEDEKTGELHYTAVACRLLDRDRCRCRDYAHRSLRVRDCVVLSADNHELVEKMPPTCAYRLVHEGHHLPSWHPLVSGNCDSVHDACISVRGRCLDEQNVPLDALEGYVISLVEEPKS